MCVGPAQEDYDFHVGLLGLRSIKNTVLFDGTLPIYHLYYANAAGDPSSILTTFPFRRAGIRGRGSNQIKRINLSVPARSLDYWADRLASRGIEAERTDVLGTSRLLFDHPCGIPYSLIAVEGDGREAWTGSDVPAEPDLEPGTWKFGEGTVHHVAYDAVSAERQMELKLHIEGLGYTDVSDVKDRQYFHSCYVRSPSGALFELAVSVPKSFAVDEDPDRLGTEFKLPPQFEDRREELISQLEPIQTEVVAG